MGALLFACGGLVLILFLFYCFERRTFSVSELAIVCALSLLAGIGRIPFAVLPSIQPTTFVVIISGAVFGPLMGAVVGASAAIISNSFLGHGPWTLLQAAAWGACGFSAGIFSYPRIPRGRLVLGSFGFVWGLFFGAVMNTWYWLAFAVPLSVSSWLVVSASSIWFDLAHAAANLLLLFFFGSYAIERLEHYRKRSFPGISTTSGREEQTAQALHICA